jgi:hypothetical protein
VPMKCLTMNSLIGYVQCGETEVGKTCDVCGTIGSRLLLCRGPLSSWAVLLFPI